MKRIAQIIALLALVATIAPPVWFLFTDGSDANLSTVKNAMLGATIVWFISATLWLWKDDDADMPRVDDDEAAVL